MNAFTSHDLGADAFPQAGVGPPGVRRAGREPALVPPVAGKCGCGKACGCRCCGPRGTAAATPVTLCAQATGLEAEPASRGMAAG
jgi:hypothetical protein